MKKDSTDRDRLRPNNDTARTARTIRLTILCMSPRRTERAMSNEQETPQPHPNPSTHTEPKATALTMRHTKASYDFLAGCQWAAETFGGCLTTSRKLRKAVGERLVAAGLCVRRRCVVVDEDGAYPDRERWVTGYEMTEAGRAELERLESNTRKDGYPTCVTR